MDGASGFTGQWGYFPKLYSHGEFWLYPLHTFVLTYKNFKIRKEFYLITFFTGNKNEPVSFEIIGSCRKLYMDIFYPPKIIFTSFPSAIVLLKSLSLAK